MPRSPRRRRKGRTDGGIDAASLDSTSERAYPNGHAHPNGHRNPLPSEHAWQLNGRAMLSFNMPSPSKSRDVSMSRSDCWTSASRSRRRAWTSFSTSATMAPWRRRRTGQSRTIRSAPTTANAAAPATVRCSKVCTALTADPPASAIADQRQAQSTSPAVLTFGTSTGDTRGAASRAIAVQAGTRDLRWASPRVCCRRCTSGCPPSTAVHGPDR